jgi:hypothetical protein
MNPSGEEHSMNTKVRGFMGTHVMMVQLHNTVARLRRCIDTNH